TGHFCSVHRLAVFHEGAKPLERAVPLCRNLLERAAGLGEAAGPDLPDPLAAAAQAPDQARLGERVEMLGDRLPRDASALGQADDGERPIGAETRHQLEARLVAEGGEDRSGPGHAAAHVQVVPPPARYFSMSFVCASQPPSLARKASARRSGGSLSNP